MIGISKEERDALVERYPTAFVVRTMKSNSKRHRYYVEESRTIVKFIADLRKNSVSKEGV